MALECVQLRKTYCSLEAGLGGMRHSVLGKENVGRRGCTKTSSIKR